MRAPLQRCSPAISARRLKAFTANHSVCSCGSPSLSFHRSVVARENCAMAVPCWLYFTSGSRPRFPINITFCISCCSFFFPSCFVWPLRAAACASTRSASVAGSAPHHQRTADIADGRISHLNHCAERANRVFTLGIGCQLTGYWNRSKQLALVPSNEFQFDPAKNVINNGLGYPVLGISGPTAGLKAHMREFAAKHFEGYPILQSQRYRSCKRIHEPGDGRALLCHGDEDLPRQAVLVNSDREISLLSGDGEVMGKCPPLVRQAPAHRARGFRDCTLILCRRWRRCCWLGALPSCGFVFINRIDLLCC